MLTLKLPASRVFDEATESFIFYDPITLKLEHSLISLHRWESKWHKSFLNSENLTSEENLDYVRCMSLDPNFDATILYRLGVSELNTIQQYIKNPMSATVIYNHNQDENRRQTVTAELIYYWMISFGIPFECSKWHLNQLFALINICAIKNNPKKMTAREAGKQRAAINKARRAKFGTSG